MPRDRRSTSFSASASLLYGHMRVPPSAGPSVVLWIAMMAFRPASLLWQNTTCSWPKVSRVSKIISCSAAAGARGARPAGWGVTNRAFYPHSRPRERPRGSPFPGAGPSRGIGKSGVPCSGTRRRIRPRGAPLQGAFPSRRSRRPAHSAACGPLLTQAGEGKGESGTIGRFRFCYTSAPMSTPATQISPAPAQSRPPLRFVTAASLFDGHDAAINIMRRLIQSQGAEVIHLGHNRSVEDVVRAALQEDADAIALSSYQGGHVEYMKYMVDMLREHGA